MVRLLPLKIWEKYFLKETLKTFLTFIFCFYALYILIDFSSHAGSFHHNNVRFPWLEIATYYGSDFIKRLEVLVPFALLIATVKTLTGLNLHNELIALMSSGVRIHTLLRPFLLLGIFFTGLIYLNSEIALPHAMKLLKHMENAKDSQKQKRLKQPAVQHLVLNDNTTLIFKDYDFVKEYFFDAYWIQSPNSIIHFKFLHPYTEIPLGQFVDHFSRDEAGDMVLRASYDLRLYPELQFNTSRLAETLTTAEELSLAELSQQISKAPHAVSEKQAYMLSVYYYKLFIPWLCLLAVIGPAPFCIRHTRQLPVFLIYSCGIFGLVSLYLILDAAFLLGKRQVIDPFWAIGFPFALFFGFFGYKYAITDNV